MFSSFHFYVMGLMYFFFLKWICKQFENKSMNLILNLSFYQKSGIPEKEGKVASLYIVGSKPHTRDFLIL